MNDVLKAIAISLCSMDLDSKERDSILNTWVDKEFAENTKAKVRKNIIKQYNTDTETRTLPMIMNEYRDTPIWDNLIYRSFIATVIEKYNTIRKERIKNEQTDNKA